MGTAFTYQGHLYDANHAADGEYDFEFTLYDANEGGSQLAGPIEVNDYDVIDGYFTVELDFGCEVFDGNAVWLETTVAHGDGSDPCTLSPRQEITPVPYALQTRGIFVDTAGNVGIGTTSPGAKLEVNGDLKVTGAYKGNLGPNNGAPFPRPAYDSGWVDGCDCEVWINWITLFHNIGGNVDDYVVKAEAIYLGGGGLIGIHNCFVIYSNITTSSIDVCSEMSPNKLRVRIWVYN